MIKTINCSQGAQAPVSKKASVASRRAIPLVAQPDKVHIRFQGNNTFNNPSDSNKQESKSIWTKMTHGPAPKLIAGSVLLAGGIAVKVFGIATVIGAPVLVPIGLGSAVVGACLVGWGAVQCFKSDKSAEKISNPSESLFKASHEGNMSLFKRVLDTNYDVNKTFPNGATPLQLNAGLGNLEAVKLLIEKNAKLDTQNEDGVTALELAAQEGKPEVVKELLKAGANPNLGKGDSFPILAASYKGHADIVEELIKAKVDVNQTNNDAASPLLLATYKGHYNIVKALVEAGANVFHQHSSGETAFQIAERKGFEDIANYLRNQENSNLNLNKNG